MEAATAPSRRAGYLPAVIELCHANGALFVLDEMITGLPLAPRRRPGLTASSPTSPRSARDRNGFPLSALAGRREMMELGGLRTDRDRVFLLSTTHGGETCALAAGLATIREYQQHDVIGHLRRTGEALREGITDVAQRLGLDPFFKVLGHPANLIYATPDQDGRPSQPFRTLFLQETIRRGR